MESSTQADYGRLEAYFCDVILEEQLKLGYEKETIRFYSPCASVGHILHLEDRTCESVYRALLPFRDLAKETLGDIVVSKCSGERVCFLIPAKGAAYVHENWKRNPFLEELIACFGRHGITLSDVQQVFQKWSEDVRCIHIGSDGVDDVLYFENGVPDSYRYCVKFDAGHASYHRFLKEDFEELFGEEQAIVGKEHGLG